MIVASDAAMQGVVQAASRRRRPGQVAFRTLERNLMGLFSKQPKLHTCVFCSEAVPDESQSKHEHYKTHLIEVTDNNGHQAYTFECPRCGLMDQAWGGGRSHPQESAVSAIAVHFMERHTNFDLL
jgi:hypothetical protein